MCAEGKGGSVPNLLSKRLSEIQGANKAELRRLWQEIFPDSPPPNLRQEMLRAVLAHRVQEQSFGSSSSALVARLRQIARTIESDPEAAIAMSSAIKPGTRLVRRWKGRNHLVTVEPSGFDYRGQRYEKLSEIARLITGTRWSGPLFFGLCAKPAVSEVRHAE